MEGVAQMMPSMGRIVNTSSDANEVFRMEYFAHPAYIRAQEFPSLSYLVHI